MKLAVNNPNLSVILPVGCNARCEFCYWEAGSGLTKNRLDFIVNTLPDIFNQCTVTGGEPTLCVDLIGYLDIIKKRFSKTVLNTNGSFLNKEYIDKVTHVNISRHHYDDTKNAKVFNTDKVPNTDKLREFCSYGDVTLNCVLPFDFIDKDFILKYIRYAKSVGAKVAFRKYFSDIDILREVDCDDTLVGQHSCGACLHRWHKIEGVDVTFKYGVKETSEHVNGIYELIVQPNGDLTFDWAGKNKLIYKEK